MCLGQERFRTITKAFYRGAQWVFIVFDVCNRESFISLQNWLSDVRSQCPTDGPLRGITILGNKCDMKDNRQVPKEEAELFVHHQNLQGYADVSSLSKEGIEEVFRMASINILKDLPHNNNNDDIVKLHHPEDQPKQQQQKATSGCCK